MRSFPPFCQGFIPLFHSDPLFLIFQISFFLFSKDFTLPRTRYSILGFPCSGLCRPNLTTLVFLFEKNFYHALSPNKFPMNLFFFLSSFHLPLFVVAAGLVGLFSLSLLLSLSSPTAPLWNLKRRKLFLRASLPSHLNRYLKIQLLTVCFFFLSTLSPPPLWMPL